MNGRIVNPNTDNENSTNTLNSVAYTYNHAGITYNQAGVYYNNSETIRPSKVLVKGNIKK